MNAYFKSLLGTKNVRRSQVLLVEDKAAMPASELLEQLHDFEDESSSSDQVPRVSCVSLDMSALTSRHSFNQEDDVEELDNGAWLLNVSESSIGTRQSNEEISKSDPSKNKSEQR